MTTDHAATEPTPLDVDREAHEILHSSTDQVVTPADGLFVSALSWKSVLVILAVAGAGLFGALLTSIPPERVQAIGMGFIGIIVATLLIVWFATRNAATRRLAYEPSLPLTKRAWLSGTAGNWPHSFDAALWISASGPTGPRIINCNLDPIHVAPEPNAHEEIDVAAELARTLVRSKMAWVLPGLILVLMIPQLLIVLRGPVRPSTTFIALAPFALIIFSMLMTNGWMPILRQLIIASPGRIEYTNFGRSLTFTRDNSVILVTRPSFNGWGRLIFLRNDRKHVAVPIRASNAPALNALLARWSYPTLASETPTPTP